MEWTLKTIALNKVEAFEMWIFRKMLKVFWIKFSKEQNSKTGNSLKQSGEGKYPIWNYLEKRMLIEFLRLILQGKIEGGKRRIERRKLG